MTGKIARLNTEKGFGFIKDDAGKDYFFHQSAIYGEGMDMLRVGDSVEFTVGQGEKARAPRMFGGHRRKKRKAGWKPASSSRRGRGDARRARLPDGFGYERTIWMAASMIFGASGRIHAIMFAAPGPGASGKASLRTLIPGTSWTISAMT